MTVSARNHRRIRRLAVLALAIGALGLTAPLATAETLSSQDTVHTAPAERKAPAPAAQPANEESAPETSPDGTGD
ncbi:MAG TPA: hypothetical protein VGA66_05790 [Mycobacterium sp.]